MIEIWSLALYNGKNVGDEVEVSNLGNVRQNNKG